ncbi:MAG: GTPase ObgE [Alphaproteobacteria bacterium]|nr:GTPase ObgE [Alphaproteobacteria bacterium]
MKFLDYAKIYVKSGNGGPGCLSFRREKFIPRGGPNGGDGGRGGSVYFVAVPNLNTLIDFRYQQHFTAKNGGPGEGRDRSGRDAPDLIVRVPVGTEVRDENDELVLCDLAHDGDRVLIAKGGDGGFGNAHYKSSTNRAPRRADRGWPGEERTLILRLKLIADIGIVGLPNAGKSTFLAAVSRAKPKIADYPFTTLTPQLGVVGVDDAELVVADIPGLIEGAHQGAGLGHEFLGHIERCGALLHLIDATEPNVATAYRTIRAELEAHGHGLAGKPEVIALNKCDALTPAAIAKVKAKLKRATRAKAWPISAAAGTGCTDVLRALAKKIRIRDEPPSRPFPHLPGAEAPDETRP